MTPGTDAPSLPTTDIEGRDDIARLVTGGSGSEFVTLRRRDAED